jgi:succinylglutamate desuccinylase
MVDLLALTLAQQTPEQMQGETVEFTWQWLGEGLLQCTPKTAYRKTMVLSAGIHGNETAPIELLSHIISDLFAEHLKLAVRVLFVLGNPKAIRQGVRYLENDMNRMFCGAYQQLAQDDETHRAAQLEQCTSEFLSKVSLKHSAIIMICTLQFVHHYCLYLHYFPIKHSPMMTS